MKGDWPEQKIPTDLQGCCGQGRIGRADGWMDGMTTGYTNVVVSWSTRCKGQSIPQGGGIGGNQPRGVRLFGGRGPQGAGWYGTGCMDA